MKKEKIVIKYTESAIYCMHMQEKDNRFTNAFKIAILRDDFYGFLKEYKDNLLNNPGNAKKLLASFLDKIQQTKYFSELDIDKRRDNLKIISNLLRFYYPTFIFPHEPMEGKTMIYDKQLNYPHIYHSVIFAETFEKNVLDGLYLEDIPPIGVVNGIDENRPRLLQITCDDNVKKEELIQYIEKFWGTMNLYLDKERRAKEASKSRDKTSKNFLRDVDIYNRYYELDIPAMRREFQVASEFTTSSELLTPESVRKIVANMNNLLRGVNT